MTELHIRECRHEEAEAVLALWRHAETTASVTDTIAHVQNAIAVDHAHVLVAEVGSGLVGSVIGTFDGWRGNIYRLAVHQSYRRLGLARALVAEVAEHLAQQGVKRITALVEKDHPWATGFWDDVDYERDIRMIRYVRSLSSGTGQ